MLGLYDVIQLVTYEPVLCSLTLRFLQEINLTRYGGDDHRSFGYDFKPGQVFDVPPLYANNRSNMGSGVTVDVPGRKA